MLNLLFFAASMEEWKRSPALNAVATVITFLIFAAVICFAVAVLMRLIRGPKK